MLLLLWSRAALAHRPGLSYVRVDQQGLSVVLARPELAELFPMEDLRAVDTLLVDRFLAVTRVSAGGAACELGPATVERVESDGIALSAPLTCSETGAWTVEAPWLAELEPGHRSMVEAFGLPVAVLDLDLTTATFEAAPDPAAVAYRFGELGVEHIVTGYDHLLFLAGLLLVARSLREMLLVATGFTLAHSVTLSLAATGVFTLPSSFVEPAIAASIIYVGVENFWRPPPRRRLMLTFALGLLHGFGFAGMLAELGLPRDHLALALLSFNFGVELGQAAIVLLLLPILLWMRRHGWWEARAVPLGSVAVATMGLYWLIERLAAG